MMRKYGKHTLIGWSWRILLGIVLTPIFLFLLLSILIYVPPVQKYAVEKAAEVLSEEMGMDVSVGSFSLKFPLHLSMGEVLAVEEGDTVLYAHELDVSVKALPLFKLKAEVDGIHLYDTQFNTKSLIDACVVKGRVAELSLDSHSTDLKQEYAVVNKALMRDADLLILLQDTVPPDTAEIEPVMWKVQLDDVELQRVKARVLLSPQADSTYVMADISRASAKGFLDLGKEIYRADELVVERSKASLELRNEPRLSNQLDPSHLFFSDVEMRVDSFEYRGTGDMHLNIRHLSGVEQSGLNIQEAIGRVEMDSLSLTVPRLHVKTADSDLRATYRMDINAFEEVNPGTFSLKGEGQIGKDDLIFFTRMGGPDTRDVCTMMRQRLSPRPIEAQIEARGNMETLDVPKFYAKVPGIAVVEGKTTLWDLTKDLSLSAELNAKDTKGGSATIKGGYAMASDSYHADMNFRNLLVSHYALMEDSTLLTGKATVSGRGFEFMSPSSLLDAKAYISQGYMGKINLSEVDADASLKGGKVLVNLKADNDQVQCELSFDGTLKKHLIEGVLSLNLPFLDAQKMGFAEDVLTASTNADMQFSYDMDKLLRVESNIDALNLHLGNDSITTDAFFLLVEALKDTTSAVLLTGDLEFSFFSPHNVFDIMPKVERLQKEVVSQFTNHDVNLYELKGYLPELSLHANAGGENPLLDVLKMYGIHWGTLQAEVKASPVTGLMANAHVYNFKKDSLLVDTAFFDVRQDSLQLDYHVGVQCHDQPKIPAFRAYLDGFLKANEVDAHLTYFDKKDVKGIDLGVRGLATDSCVNYHVYPEKPVLAYREFAVNADNYITTRPNKPIMADVRLESTSDSMYLAVYADESSIGNQIANVIANDINIQEILAVLPVPGLPKMAGNLNLDATYIDQGENYLVEGKAEAEHFMYEGTRVGDLSSHFTYEPHGEWLHTIDASLSYNEREIVSLDGTYNAEGKGGLDADMHLLDVPMELLSAFIPNQVVSFKGQIGGGMKVKGPMDALLFNGALVPQDVHLLSVPYNIDLGLDDDSIRFVNSRVDFDDFHFYGRGDEPLALNGYVDFSNLEEVMMSLSLNGRNFSLIKAKRASKSLLYGDMYGDFFARVIGSTKDLTIRGLVRVLPTTNITYVMSETALYQADRLEDIVTFVDFSVPPPPKEERVKTTFTGIDMNITLSIEEGAKLNGEFSADQQSYVNVQGGGTLTMTYTPGGVLNMQGRYTINEGEMKYTLPVIPLKTFRIHEGSYVEFIGDPTNPVLSIAATERVNATVGESDGTSRTVAFDTGLKITNTLNNLGLEFTIEAPEDMSVQNELAGASPEEKNKLAVGMLATGMYLSGNNRKGFTAGNALNAFLQNEINNIAGKAMSTMVEVNVGMEKTTRDDGTTRTDYSFQFSRRFFSDRLNVIIGGKVSSDGNTERDESGAYIDDVSLEWRLNKGGTQYIRLFHEKDFSNLIEGEIDKNGAGVLLRRKVDKLSDLLIWKKQEEPQIRGIEERGEERRDSRNASGRNTSSVNTSNEETSSGNTTDGNTSDENEEGRKKEERNAEGREGEKPSIEDNRQTL